MDDTNRRDCHRLLALVRQSGSAEKLATNELLALSDWIAQPPSDAGAYQWCEDVCLPIVRELASRLDRRITSARIDIPQLLSQVHAMRSLQRKVSKSRTLARAEKLQLLHEQLIAEQSIDAIVDEFLQPMLFAEKGQ